MDYYTIHEMNEGRIGFAPHNKSLKPKLEIAENPPLNLIDGGVRIINADQESIATSEYNPGPTWAWLLALLLLLLSFYIWYNFVSPAITACLPDDKENSWVIYVKLGVMICYSIMAIYLCLVYARQVLNEYFSSEDSTGGESISAFDETQG